MTNSPERLIIGKGRVPAIIRRQHCIYCNTVLALELSDKLGYRAQSEYWSVTKEGLWIKGRWYGNTVTCPNCGATGKLPIDKPLSAESIERKSKSQLETERKLHEKAEKIKTREKGNAT